MLWIQNGRLIDPYTGTDGQRDILIGDDGRILAVEEKMTDVEAPVLDIGGKTVAPGFVDVHVHFRDPGQTYKEDLTTGSQAAVAGGYTTVVCMANTKPTCDNVEILQEIQARAAKLPIHVLQSGAVTQGLAGKVLADMDGMAKIGAPGFTDDGINLTDPEICRQAMEKAAALGLPLSFHEEDPRFIENPGINAGSAAAQKLGLGGASRQAEIVMIQRDIELARQTGAKVNFQHLSAKESVDLIRKAKAEGISVYAEVTPHHISLTEDAVLAHGTLAKMNPPLRTEADRQALIAGLQDGTIDMIATDHAPHSREEKDKPFTAAPSGIIGLETAFSVCATYLVHSGKLTPYQLIEKMSVNPAKLYGLTGKAVVPGNPAELVILDWEAPVTYTQYRSKAANTPFTGMPLKGKADSIVMGCQQLHG